MHGGRTKIWGLVALLAAMAGGLSFWMWQQDDSQAVVLLAKKLHLQGKSAETLAVLDPILQRPDANGDACFLAGDAAARLKNFESATEFYARVPQNHARRAEACFRAGDILLLRLYRLSDAETMLREAVAIQPDHPAAAAHLAGLYGLCGLTSLTTQLRLERLRAGQFTEVDLVLLALGDTAAENADSLRDYLSHSPNDPLTKLASAHHAWQQHDLTTAVSLYQNGLQTRPDLFDAQTRLGRSLMELSRTDDFLKWHAGLSPAGSDHADIWAVRGEWSLRQGDPQGAVRCYWEAARRDATHRSAHHQIGQTLASLGQATLAENFQRRNECLQELLLTAKQCNLEPTPEKTLRTAMAAKRCGQPWEAWGWAEVIRKRFPQLASEVIDIGRPTLSTGRVLDVAQPALVTDLSEYPLPQWMESPVPSGTEMEPTITEANGQSNFIRFTDDAERAGLRFEFIHGDDLAGPGMRMFQFSGGGTGVLDYDRDGWPDVYFSQGGRWPVAEENKPSDELFRNVRGQIFRDATAAAGIVETSYSQGVTAGDIDGDGWTDLFVANVEENRLFQNNGDGTFSDITESAGITGSSWSTSVVCADFNGDTLPDLFVVNYLMGSDLLDRICRQADGTPRACTPHEFEPAEDQLLLNLGNGQFRDVTAESGLVAPGGKGLGVIAADFDGSGRLSLFVGNDTTANFFFQNETASAGAVPQFTESAVVTGLAFDREGRTQACMGIAAGDADGDQQLDLFVTNYYNESNTLYQRQPGLMFFDATMEARLKEPSIRQLGFGTQFLDADLDGWSDLIVTNGHVDDESARGIPLHMPTQFFHNTGTGHFDEITATQLGPWFAGKYLGRAVARIDWNRDGREDFLVGNLDSPAALLTNHTVGEGKFLAIQLIGTTSAREAIGATVEVRLGARTLSRQLVAGDGYQASNERQLVFGVGAADAVDITVRWPSGRSDVFERVPTSAFWTAVEGRSALKSADR